MFLIGGFMMLVLQKDVVRESVALKGCDMGLDLKGGVCCGVEGKKG